MSRVLIVEDDEVIAGGMARHLAVAGFEPMWVDKGEQGSRGCASSGPTSACST